MRALIMWVVCVFCLNNAGDANGVVAVEGEAGGGGDAAGAGEAMAVTEIAKKKKQKTKKKKKRAGGGGGGGGVPTCPGGTGSGEGCRRLHGQLRKVRRQTAFRPSLVALWRYCGVSQQIVN